MPPKKPTFSARPAPPPPAPAAALDEWIAKGADAPTIPNHPEMPGDGSNHLRPSRTIPATRAAKGTRKLMTRSDGRTSRRLQVYLTPELAEELETLARAERRELSGLVEEGLRLLMRARRAST